MKRKLFFLAALLTAIVMNLHADTANIDLTSGHTTSGQIQVTYNLDANISIVITCPEANISNEGNQGTSFDAYSGVSSLAIKAAEGCKITAATLTFYSSMYTPGYDGVGFLPGSSTSGISNSDEYSYYSGSASEVVWNFTEMELPCILSKASVTYTKPEPACQIGTQKYESIAAAIAEVKAGETIQVIKDIQLDAVINVTSSTPAFTLDLNGHILDGSKLVNQSLLYNASTLSIIDSNPTATHAAPFDTIAGAIMTGGKGWKTVSDSYGGAIYNYNNGTLHVKGVAFVNNTADYGGGVYSYQAASTFKNCRFYGNMGTEYGAALYINGNTCSIDSCVFQENASDCGILLSYKATIHVNGSTFVKDSATWGGAAYLDQSTSTFKNCRFNGNKSTQHGGAIYVGGNTCSIDSCVFQENASYCGIVYGNNQATVNVNGSEFVKNTATLGGAAYFYEATSVFKNCSFKENTAEDDGNDNGYGIVYCYKSQGSMDSCVVEDNNAKYGILYAMQASSLTIAHTTINNNSCSSYPGAVGVFGSSLTLNDGTVITNNTSGADYQSAGVYVWNESGYTNTVAMSGKVIIKDNTTNGQPANLCLSGETHCDTVALNGLSAGSEVNVCTMINDTVAPATFATNATEADMQYFKSDNGYAIVRENTNLATKDTLDYLHFVGLNGNDTVRLNKVADTSKGGGDLTKLTATFEYSTDRKTWTPYDKWATSAEPQYTYQGEPIALNQGDTVWFRALGANKDGKNKTLSEDYYTYFNFVFGADDSIAAGGNTMSLYDATCEQDSMTAGGFCQLFSNATQMVSAPTLPVKKIKEFCYQSMFDGCTNLTTAPELPATTIDKACYNGMFYGCTSLTAAPALPANQLSSYCYYSMFNGCTSLTQAPELKPTELEAQCCFMMFKNCTSLEVDTCLNEEECKGALLIVPAKNVASWSKNMFAGCKGDAKYTATYGIKSGGHYCIRKYVPACKENIENKTICYGESIMWRGTDCYETKAYHDTLRYEGTQYDSVHFTLNLKVTELPIEDTKDSTICYGESIMWRGKTCDKTMAYHDTLRYDGTQCDSVHFTLNLKVTELPIEDTKDSTICYGESIMWRGKTCDKTMAYHDTLRYDGTQCDSVHFTLNLKVTELPIEDTKDSTIYYGESIMWRGKTCDKTMAYHDTLRYDGTQCDSIHFTLNLTVKSPVTAQIEAMYENWNMVFNKNKLILDFDSIGVKNVVIEPEDVHWYIAKGDQDAINQTTGLPNGDDEAANPATGFFHTEDKAMMGAYYVIVKVEEAKAKLGIEYFTSNVLKLSAPEAPARNNAKYIQNGQLIIEYNGEQYNAQGMKL